MKSIQSDLDLVRIGQNNFSPILNKRIHFENGIFADMQKELTETKIDCHQINATNLDLMKTTLEQLAQAQNEIKNLNETFVETKLMSYIQLNQIRKQLDQLSQAQTDREVMNRSFVAMIESICNQLVQDKPGPQNLSQHFELIRSQLDQAERTIVGLLIRQLSTNCRR